MGAKLRVLSGRPFTPFDEVRSAQEFPITGRGVPDWDRIGAEYADRCLEVWREAAPNLTPENVVYLDVQNVLNRANPIGYLYTLDPTFPDRRRPVDGTALLPFFGFSVEF